uniref:Uncharacterized protein n=1 Tax=Octopus bimaculoides TaxID=37653 RepID=A0A0L8G3S9_OCTBM
MQLFQIYKLQIITTSTYAVQGSECGDLLNASVHCYNIPLNLPINLNDSKKLIVPTMFFVLIQICCATKNPFGL